MLMKVDAALSAPPLVVAGAKLFFGYTLPEWAALVTIIYTCVLMLRMAFHAWRGWKEKRNAQTH